MLEVTGFFLSHIAAKHVNNHGVSSEKTQKFKGSQEHSEGPKVAEQFQRLELPMYFNLPLKTLGKVDQATPPRLQALELDVIDQEKQPKKAA